MATISLYVSGQTELGDLTEFFQKNLMNAGEHPVAFFDGVFYESHQERVGNIVFQDYLIYSDKAVYLWARGANKDYLDRFTLGSVIVNSRNKDSEFATINLKIRREEKEPVYVIFDMVERREAELITKLHSLVESTIDDALGINYRKEIPDPVSARVFQVARDVCPFQSFSLPLTETPSVEHHGARQNSEIGYGQDLLEQYKASINYGAEEQSFSSSPNRAQAGPQSRNPAADAAKGLENMIPTDPASLKRIASSIKDLVGEAPFRLREQVVKDLQHVPGDMATVLTALNELLANIAGNPQAERFVMTAITTAVKNDGVLGSISKVLRLTTGFGSGGSRNSASKSAKGGAERVSDDASGGNAGGSVQDGDTSIRRKKITIKEDDALAPSADHEPGADSADDASGMHRKKISIRADESSASALVRDMMDMDPLPVEEPPASARMDAAPEGEAPQRKKINIVTDTVSRPEGVPGDADASFKESGVPPIDRETDDCLSEEELARALGEPSGTAQESREKGVAGSGASGEGVADATSDVSGKEPAKKTIKIKSTQ